MWPMWLLASCPAASSRAAHCAQCARVSSPRTAPHPHRHSDTTTPEIAPRSPVEEGSARETGDLRSFWLNPSSSPSCCPCHRMQIQRGLLARCSLSLSICPLLLKPTQLLVRSHARGPCSHRPGDPRPFRKAAFVWRPPPAHRREQRKQMRGEDAGGACPWRRETVFTVKRTGPAHSRTWELGIQAKQSANEGRQPVR